MATVDFRSDPAISEKWKTRFAFFEQFGAPSTQTYKDELKKLEYKQRLLINFNFFAFFFGVIYMAIIGLWKKALAILGMAVAINVVLYVIHAPGPISRGVGIGFGVLCAMCVNYALYLKKVKGQDGWNPFEGMRW